MQSHNTCLPETPRHRSFTGPHRIAHALHTLEHVCHSPFNLWTLCPGEEAGFISTRTPAWVAAQAQEEGT